MISLHSAVTEDDPDDTPRTHVTDGERRAHFQTWPPGVPTVGDAVEQDLHIRVTSLEESRRTWRWIVGLGLIPLLGLVVMLMAAAIGEVRTSSERTGETRADIRALKERVDQLERTIEKTLDAIEQDVRELRRHAGLAPRGTVAVGGP